MNTSSPTAPLQTPAVSAPPRPLRGLYASLERLINTASFVSVDLTDTIFASLPSDRGAPAEPAVPPVPLARRPDQSRMLSVQLP